MLPLLLLSVPLAMADYGELGSMTIKLEGYKEKCLVEGLMDKTVAMIKHRATLHNGSTGALIDPNAMQLQVSIRVKPHTHTLILFSLGSQWSHG